VDHGSLDQPVTPFFFRAYAGSGAHPLVFCKRSIYRI
jgi:hypothetical protein